MLAGLLGRVWQYPNRAKSCGCKESSPDPSVEAPPQPNPRCQVQGFISTSTRILLFRLSQLPDKRIRRTARSSLLRYCLCSMVGENPSREEFDGFHCVLRVAGNPRSPRCAYRRAISRGWRTHDARILFPLRNPPCWFKHTAPIGFRLSAWRRRQRSSPRCEAILSRSEGVRNPDSHCEIGSPSDRHPREHPFPGRSASRPLRAFHT